VTLFGFYCRDGENGAALREKFLAQHLAYIETALDKIAVAGPLKQGEETVGSLLVIKAENEAEARAVFEGDPYFDAGVWQSITVDQFLGVAGDWVGGATWK
jgi:uncharacterized protein YciI